MRAVSEKSPSSDARARREAELAEALRANLRRRKAAAAEQPAEAEKDDAREKGEQADPTLPPSRGRV